MAPVQLQPAAESSTGRRNGRGALLVSNLPALQNLIKRDPGGYADDFRTQWNSYESARRIIELGIAGGAGGQEGDGRRAREAEDRWRELVSFIAQVAACYPTETAAFPSHITSILLNSHASLAPDTRKTLIQSLVLLRSRDMISGIDLLKVLFPLLTSTTSATLRSYLVHVIYADIKAANRSSQNHKLNRTVQGLLFDMVERGRGAEIEGTGVKGRKGKAAAAASTSGSAREAMMAVKLASDLWRKRIWTDAKTVQILASACLHPNTKVQSAAIHFFLSPSGASDGSMAVDSDEDADAAAGPDMRQVKHQQKVNKKTRANEKLVARKNREAARKQQARERAGADAPANFSALHLLQDPQSFSEKLYAGLVAHDKHWTIEHRVLVMQLFGRLCGAHQLIVLGFYGYVTRYLVHHQLEVTRILVALASSVHDLTPPDELEPVVRKIASEFVHPGVAAEVVAAGLNAIREICRRQPGCMDADLLSDLVEYKKSKDKGVMVAARSLLQLYREVAPSLLKRSERGKLATMNGANGPVQFGQDRNVVTGIQGIELLEEHLAEKTEVDDSGDEAAWNDWNVEDDDARSDDSGGWIDVVSDDDADIVIDDSDDEAGPTKSRKRRKLSQTPAELVDDDPSLGAPSPAPTSVLMRNIAEERILTPADFAKLDELRLAAAEDAAKTGSAAAKRKLAALSAQRKASKSRAAGLANGVDSDGRAFLTESDILSAKRKKDDYETRMASIAKGREGREKFGSAKGKSKKAVGASSTNEAKRKGKNYQMMQASSGVVKKKFASLKLKQVKLRGHIQTQKSGRRRNGARR